VQPWLQRNPDNTWEAEERERRDVALWKSETERTALAGSQVFHRGDELGSTIGVSGDIRRPRPTAPLLARLGRLCATAHESDGSSPEVWRSSVTEWRRCPLPAGPSPQSTAQTAVFGTPPALPERGGY
jgi:hypothetical protein